MLDLLVLLADLLALLALLALLRIPRPRRFDIFQNVVKAPFDRVCCPEMVAVLRSEKQKKKKEREKRVGSDQLLARWQSGATIERTSASSCLLALITLTFFSLVLNLSISGSVSTKKSIPPE